jgi:4-alpha-glucanotransferase
MNDALQRLADYLGVMPSYVGYDGREQRTSPETQRAILRAMGVAAETDAAAAEVLGQLQDEDLRQPLDPVVVHRHDERNVIRVRVPRRAGVMRWKVSIRSERGRVASRSGLHDSAAPLEIETPNFGPGYYDVRITLTTKRGETEASQSLIVVPHRCALPEDVLGSRKAWGVFANLYSVRGQRNWGIGDTGDLTELVKWIGGAGGDFIGLNPLHALLNRGGDISPYGPVTRLWRNPAYIDVERVPEFADSARVRVPEIEASIETLRESSQVEYERIWATKRLVLDALHACFLERSAHQATHPRVAAYNEFVARGGRSLHDFATWMTIAEVRGEWNFRMWPADLQDARSDAVRRFAADHARPLAFHKWAQFELDQQLGAVAAESDRSGMCVGLYQDLAIGSSGTGSDVWAHRDLFRDGVTVGAPPDPYSDIGQNWGFPPVDPRSLQRDGYRYFIRLVRGALRHAGALRIDHVMGLFRLFWIPEGATGKDGAYVRYPHEDLLGILALESQRHEAIIVGEDLGVVPDYVPPAMRQWGILSSKVLFFEREDGGGFKPQAAYPPLSLASANTHDMPTIAGFWSGRDLELRKTVGLTDPTAGDDSLGQRDREKSLLVERLRNDGALPLHEHPAADRSGAQPVKRAVHGFLAESPATLVALSLDDLGDEIEPVNVPGVGLDKYPSWSRRMHRTVAEIAASSADDIAICSSRGRAV